MSASFTHSRQLAVGIALLVPGAFFVGAASGRNTRKADDEVTLVLEKTC